MSIISEPLESLGDSITTAVLLSWNKEPGDSVKEDDVVAVVETDKVLWVCDGYAMESALTCCICCR
jgi:hypothetical protein